MDKLLTFPYRPLPLTVLVVGFALANGCGRTEMDVLASAGGAIAGKIGSESGGAGGVGGSSQAGTGGVSSGGAGGGASGVCGEALCLTSLFQTCVAEGNCFARGGGSPSAVFNDTCYANGVTVSYYGSYNFGASNVTGERTVSRKGDPCYKIETLSDGVFTYVFRDAQDQQVATGTADNKGETVSVTCNGSKPTTVSYACINPISNSGECTLDKCP